jgi:predicted DNA binding CopG/RHH family protein
MREHDDFSHGQQGSVINADGKTRVTRYLDDDLLAVFGERAAAQGLGYQTLINETLRASLSSETAPLTEAQLRQVLHEMLPAA